MLLNYLWIIMIIILSDYYLIIYLFDYVLLFLLCTLCTFIFVNKNVLILVLSFSN